MNIEGDSTLKLIFQFFDSKTPFDIVNKLTRDPCLITLWEMESRVSANEATPTL